MLYNKTQNQRTYDDKKGPIDTLPKISPQTSGDHDLSESASNFCTFEDPEWVLRLKDHGPVFVNVKLFIPSPKDLISVVLSKLTVI